MPELPEVETVRRGLVDHLLGRTVTEVEVLHPRAVRRQPPDTDLRVVTGRRIEAIRRRGKYLWFALSPTDSRPDAPGDAIIAHLGMSGQFRFVDPGTPAHPHLRIRMDLETSTDPGSAPTRQTMWFLDQRTFGGMQLSPRGAELPVEIAHIGRDLLDPAFDQAAVVERIRHKHVGIKRVLLDQTVTSGIGNIYADEALWYAEVHGDRLADTLTRPRIHRLLDAVTRVFTEALALGGTSFDSLYVNVNGESGYFDRSLKAYGQTDRPCPRCGTPIRRSSFMNRSSHFCPRCQPAPRVRRSVRSQVGASE